MYAKTLEQSWVSGSVCIEFTSSLCMAPRKQYWPVRTSKMQELTGAWYLIYRKVTVSTYLLELTFEDCLKIHQIKSTWDLT